MVRKREFEPELDCKALPTVPQLASSAPRGHATPENAVSPIATLMRIDRLQATGFRPR
jgi:hypothetical protein